MSSQKRIFFATNRNNIIIRFWRNYRADFVYEKIKYNFNKRKTFLLIFKIREAFVFFFFFFIIKIGARERGFGKFDILIFFAEFS
jgi:hypothetical protein